jgi:phosphate transport system substrate-binding protein
VQLVGAGATFPAPLYKQWFKDYKAAHPNVVVEYQGGGSGAGISQFTTGTVDFGASDAAMNDTEIAAVKGGVVLLPMTAGEVVLSYNLDGVPDLKLTREAYVGIFMGKITKWNDPVIGSANPGVNLPDKPINVVHRADASGTTYVFTHHLAAVDPAWKAGPGVGKTAQWPNGQTGGKGNDGVTNAIKTTPGSIGYVEYNYAMTSGLPMTELQNKAGKFVKCTPEAGAVALATVTMPPDLRAWAPDPDGDASYPIVTYTWLLCHPKYDDAAKGKALKDVINYGLTEGQKTSKDLGYIPLPDSVVTKVKEKADTIQAGG